MIMSSSWRETCRLAQYVDLQESTMCCNNALGWEPCLLLQRIDVLCETAKEEPLLIQQLHEVMRRRGLVPSWEQLLHHTRANDQGGAGHSRTSFGCRIRIKTPGSISHDLRSEVQQLFCTQVCMVPLHNCRTGNRPNCLW